MTNKNVLPTGDTVSELERLRDILYGERVRSIEERLEEMDQRLLRTTTEMNRRVDHETEELTRRIDTLGKRLDERLLALQTQSSAELRAVSNAQTQALAETRAALQSELDAFQAELRAWREKTAQTLQGLGAQWLE